jgi:hypothetical protein
MRTQRARAARASLTKYAACGKAERAESQTPRADRGACHGVNHWSKQAA